MFRAGLAAGPGCLARYLLSTNRITFAIPSNARLMSPQVHAAHPCSRPVAGEPFCRSAANNAKAEMASPKLPTVYSVFSKKRDFGAASVSWLGGNGMGEVAVRGTEMVDMHCLQRTFFPAELSGACCWVSHFGHCTSICTAILSYLPTVSARARRTQS